MSSWTALAGTIALILFLLALVVFGMWFERVYQRWQNTPND